MLFFDSVNDYRDPHDPTVEWYIYPEGGCVAFRNMLALPEDPPATPEREALWIAMRLIGHQGQWPWAGIAPAL